MGADIQVMPRPSLESIASKIPFVWRGIKLTEGAGSDAVFGSLRHILAQTVLISAQVRAARARESVLAELKDLGIDASIDLTAELANSIIPLGLIKKLGVTTSKVARILMKQRNHARLSGEEAALQQLGPVSDAFLDDLERLFNPLRKTYAGIPLVTLIDDARLADNDSGVPVFLEKLISRVVQQRWPLLLLLTHWSRQRRDWTDGSGVQHKRSVVSEIIEHFRLRAPNEFSRFTGTPGGALSSDKLFVEIDLGEPVDDLSPALRDQFPGLSKDVAAEILSLSRSNPRKLEQVATEIREFPSWFEEYSFDNDLTEDGREAARNLSRLEIDKIVLKRFGDTPPAVRTALLTASCVGPRFLVALIEKMLAHSGQEPPRSALEESERRYHLTRDVIDRSRNDTASFKEGLFFDAALAYDRQGLAHLEGLWPGREKMEGLLDDLVKGDMATSEMTADDLAFGQDVAGSRRSEQGRPTGGLVMAKLVALENERGNFDAASAAARRFTSGFREGHGR